MYKIVANQVVLKNGCQEFLEDIYDTSMDFYLLLLVRDNLGRTKRAFFEKGRAAGDYMLYLSKNNTRVLYQKAYEFNSMNQILNLSFILAKSSIERGMNIAKIEKLIANQNTGRNCIELLSFAFSSCVLSGDESTRISFENKILELKIEVYFLEYKK